MNPLGTLDRSQLAGVTGGLHLEHGIKNAKTGEWVWRQELDVPDHFYKPHLMVPTHIEWGIQDAKTGMWKKHETHDYLRPVPQH